MLDILFHLGDTDGATKTCLDKKEVFKFYLKIVEIVPKEFDKFVIRNRTV